MKWGYIKFHSCMKTYIFRQPVRLSRSDPGKCTVKENFRGHTNLQQKV